MDNLSKADRSRCMSRIRAKDTIPEMVVRRLVNGLGHRFRLHRQELPGCPDIVLPRHRKIIFVHGCFWHMHRCRYGRVVPKTNQQYWRRKREGNVERHRENVRELRRQEWKILVVWECWTKDLEKLEQRVLRFLSLGS